MADNLICGIDIGSSKIASMISLFNEESQSLKIIGFDSQESRGVKKGLIVDIGQVAKILEQTLEKTERMAGHKIDRAFVSVGGPHINSLNSHGIVAVSNPRGEITDEDIDRVIEAARAISLSTTREIIEIVPRDYIVDGQPGIKNPLGMSGVRLEAEAHIITASSTNLKNIDKVLSDLGVENQGFVFAGLASSEAVLTNTEKELGVVLVDIGGGKIDLAIFVDGALSYSSSIPIGARHITNDIAVGLRVSLDSAEKIKLFLSKNLSMVKKKVSQLNLHDLNLEENLTEVSLKTLVDGIISPRLEEIFKLIFEEIEKSGFAQQVPSGLVITGGGALTVGMSETGKRVIGLPIRIGVPEKISGLIDEVNDPQYSTNIGLLQYGLKIQENGDESSFKNFGKIFKDIKIKDSMNSIKNFFKQFLP